MIDKVDISCVSDLSGGQFVIETRSGDLAMTDSYNSVRFETNTAGSTQKWKLEPDMSYVNDEVMYSEIGNLFNYPIKSSSAKYNRITSGYGYRKLKNDSGAVWWDKLHNGIDIGIDETTEIFAPYDGIVKKCGYYSDFGNYVILEHTVLYKGEYRTLYTYYFHLFDYNVSVGENVYQNSQNYIARSGNTGQSTSAHLHLTISTSYRFPNLNNFSTIDPIRIFYDISYSRTSATDSIHDLVF